MNKVLSYVLLLCIIPALYSHSKIHRPEAQPNQELSNIKIFFKNFDDFLGVENLGTKSVASDHEKFIRDIIHDLKMDDYCIEIRAMSFNAQHTIGRINAFVIPSRIFGKKSHAYLYISEEWFEALSDQQKQALIRHELMHLKHDHLRKRMKFMIGSGLMMFAFNKLIQHIMAKYNDSHRLRVMVILSQTCPTLLVYSWLPLVYKYIRYTEKEADIEAAKTMINKQGFIDLFIEIESETQDPESLFKIKRFFKKLFSPLHKLFSTHPQLKERIKYINDLV